MDYDLNEIKLGELEMEIDTLEEMYKLANKIIELNGGDNDNVLIDLDFTVERDEIDQVLANKKEEYENIVKENLEIRKNWSADEKAFRREEGA